MARGMEKRKERIPAGMIRIGSSAYFTAGPFIVDASKPDAVRVLAQNPSFGVSSVSQVSCPARLLGTRENLWLVASDDGPPPFMSPEARYELFPGIANPTRRRPSRRQLSSAYERTSDGRLPDVRAQLSQCDSKPIPDTETADGSALWSFPPRYAGHLDRLCLLPGAASSDEIRIFAPVELVAWDMTFDTLRYPNWEEFPTKTYYGGKYQHFTRQGPLGFRGHGIRKIPAYGVIAFTEIDSFRRSAETGQVRGKPSSAMPVNHFRLRSGVVLCLVESGIEADSRNNPPRPEYIPSEQEGII